MASYEQEETSTKTKLLKLQCPFNWEILESMIKHTIMHFNSNNTDKNDTIDDEASCPLELLIKFLFKCYKAVLSADDDEGREMIAKAEDVLMQIQQEYDT